MKDIVERLGFEGGLETEWGPITGKDHLCVEAAKEIKRLRAELAAVKLQLGIGGHGDVVAASGSAMQVAITEMRKAVAERDALLALLPRIREGVGRWRGKHAPLSIPVRASDADILLADIDAALAAKEKE